MTEAERLSVFAREHFPEVVGDAVAPEEIGKLLLMSTVAGPPHWTGQRILKSLGILVDTDAEMRPH